MCNLRYVGSFKPTLGGGFQYLLFSPLLGEMMQFDEHIFQMGWFNHHLVLALSIQLIFFTEGPLMGM